MEQITEQLNSLLRVRHDELHASGMVGISTADLAARVYSEIDPGLVAPARVRWAATMELKQLARAICRERQVQSEHESENYSLFDIQLQPRYPTVRKCEDGTDDDVYVLRSHLSIEERKRNIDRLRREGEAKIAHADALQAETDHLVRLGQFAGAGMTTGAGE